MSLANRAGALTVGLTWMIWIGSAQSALAADAAFQSFFDDVCTNTPTGTLATRCSETGSGSGDGNLSGDSETSLNPSQVVSAHDASLGSAKERMQGIAEILEERRADESTAASQSSSFTDRLSLIANGYGEWFDRDASSNERGFDGYAAGVAVGGDFRVTPDLIVGALFNYNHTDADFDGQSPDGTPFNPFSHEGSRESDSYIVTGFGSFQFSDGFSVDANLGGGAIRHDFRRSVVFQESGRSSQTSVETRAKVDGSEFSVGGGFAYDHDLGAASVGGYARTQFVKTWIDSYDESGGNGLAMNYSKENQDSLTTTLGLRGSWAFSADFGVIVPQVRAEWEHEFKRDAFVTSTSYREDADNFVFDVKSDSPDRNYFNLGGGVVAVLAHGWMPFIDYQGLVGDRDWSRHRVTVGIRKEFR